MFDIIIILVLIARQCLQLEMLSHASRCERVDLIHSTAPYVAMVLFWSVFNELDVHMGDKPVILIRLHVHRVLLITIQKVIPVWLIVGLITMNKIQT